MDQQQNSALKSDYSLPGEFRGRNKSWDFVFSQYDMLDVKAEKYSPERNPNSLNLTFFEKIRFKMNGLAFLFGFLYYAIKGMWHKGLIILSFSIILANIFELFDNRGLNSISYVIPTIIYALSANYDFYRLSKFNEKIWPFFPSVFKNIYACLGLFVCVLVLDILNTILNTPL